MEQKATDAAIRPAATVMLLRETDRLEVLMVERHRQIDFAGGALVFPGGKVSGPDTDPDLRLFCTGHGAIDAEDLSLRVAALRELFEESGILLAREPSGDLISEDRLEPLQIHRRDLDAGRLAMRDFLDRHNLRLAVDRLTPFARWITPEWLGKRFDTHFFVAQAPAGQAPLHDGVEAVESAWLDPRKVVEEAAAGKRSVLFPTRMNLLRLAGDQTVDAVVSAARKREIVPIKPRLIEKESVKYLSIPEGMGYKVTEMPVSNVGLP